MIDVGENDCWLCVSDWYIEQPPVHHSQASNLPGKSLRKRLH